MTYQNKAVVHTLNEYFIPVQLNVEKETRRLDQYQVLWTPNINVIDHRERLVFHVEGWFSPMEYVAMLHCARGHFDLHRKAYDQAVNAFKRVAANYPQSEFAPQALYYTAVGHYLDTHEADRLMEGWKRLQQSYPTSSWAYRTFL